MERTGAFSEIVWTLKFMNSENTTSPKGPEGNCGADCYCSCHEAQDWMACIHCWPIGGALPKDMFKNAQQYIDSNDFIVENDKLLRVSALHAHEGGYPKDFVHPLAGPPGIGDPISNSSIGPRGDKLQTSPIKWENEDALPEMTDEEFKAMFQASKVHYTRLYPFVEDSRGNRIYITGTKGQDCPQMAGDDLQASLLETIAKYLDEERLHDDECSFIEVDGHEISVTSSKHGKHSFLITLSP